MEPGPIRARLALMMFGQYLIYGAWAAPLASYLRFAPEDGGLGFTPSQISWIYSTTAMAALLAPCVLGLLADRLFATERLLGALHFVGAAVLFAAARFCSTRQLALRESADDGWTFGVLMALMFANAVVLILTLALCNVTGFRNLREPKKSYGGVRLFGTVGWIVVSVALGLAGSPVSAQPLYVAAGGSLAMAAYSFTLPHTPPARMGKGIGEALGLPALSMFRHADFRVLLVCALCMAAVQQFYAVFANPFLIDLGVPKSSATALQALAQVSEVVCLIGFPHVLARYGFRATLAVGLFGWIVRNAIFATGWLPAVAAVGLPLHGMCFSFFFLVANLYVDRHAPPHLRASAQGILTFAVAGIGTLLGNAVSAQVLNANDGPGGVDWGWFWLVPAAAAVVVFAFFAGFFRDEAHEAVVTPPEPVEVPAATT
jgi:nucleoside transporter